MTLTSDDIEYIKAHMAEWLAEQSLTRPAVVYELELRERMVRVEEGLRHQQELMREGFAQTERRFQQIDQRFEQVERRFQQIDQHFEQVERRFQQIDQRFERIDQRFEQVERRFEQIDGRFQAVDGRFDQMLRRHDRQFLWLVGFIATVGGLVIATSQLG